jgi:outer membrane protein assembly factor BamB
MNAGFRPQRISLAIAVALVLPVGLQAQGKNWPSFRGAQAAGVADGYPTAVTWDATKPENVLWKAEIPGLALSSPVIWGDRVFVTTAISSDPNAKFRHGLYGDVAPSPDMTVHKWKVYALDKRTGKIVWEQLAHEGAPKTKRHPKSSQATPTPATDGKYVVAFFGSEGLYVYDFKGKLQWKKDLGALSAGWFYDPDYEWGYGASPVIYKHLVIVQCDIQKDSFVAAFDLKTGKEVWRTQRDEIPSWGTPTIYSGPPRDELITHATKFIRSYDPNTGKELWRLGPNSEVTTPTPIIAHGLIIITNGYRGIQPIYAVRPGGSGDLTLQGDAESSEFIAWSKKRGGPYTPTPVIYGDYMYVCTNNGVLTVYEAKTGKQVYQQRIGGTGGAFSASPFAADGKVYFPSEDGDIFVVKAGPTYELLGKNSMGEVLMASPAVSEGIIFVRGLKHLFAIAPPKAQATGGK